MPLDILHRAAPCRNVPVTFTLDMGGRAVEHYFWLVCGLWAGVVGAVYTRFALRKKIAAGEFTSEEVSSFTPQYALWIFVPSLAFWLLQQSIGPNAPIEYFRWPDPQRLVAFALQFFLWAAMVFWIFFKDGAATLSRYVRATRRTSNFFSSPVAMKIFAVAAPIVGLLALWSAHA